MDDTKIGKIELIIGPMCSGKSTELLRRMNRYNVKKYKCVLIKNSVDNRNADTHDLLYFNKFKRIVAKNLMDVVSNEDVNGCHVICIDEGQFFGDITEFSLKMKLNGKFVLIATLIGDFKLKPYNHINNLFPIADDISHLKAICNECNSDASFSGLRNIGDSKKMKDGNLLVGGTDIYISLCGNCYYKKNNAVK